MYRDPFDDIARMHEDMEKLFRRLYRPNAKLLAGKSGMEPVDWDNHINNRFRLPVLEFKEEDSGFKLDLEMPGVPKDNIQLNVEKDFLEVKVEDKKEEKKGSREEGSYEYRKVNRQFFRRIPFETPIDPDKVDATYKDGILHLEVPKKLEEVKRKKIEVK